MPSFGKESLKHLATVHPDLVMIFNVVIRKRDCKILCGVRTKAEQDRLFTLGKSKVVWPNSKHNVLDKNSLSNAIDAAPYFAGHNPPIIWPNLEREKIVFSKEMGIYYNFAGYVQSVADSMKIKIRWGGDWDFNGIYTDQKFDDLIHFERVIQ